MRFLFPILLSILSVTSALGQPWLELLPQQKSRSELTLRDYQRAFYDYWEPYQVVEGYYFEHGEKVKAAGYNQFKRWEWLQEQRAHPITGEFPKRSAFDIVKAHQKLYPRTRTSPAAQWTPLGPSNTPDNTQGLGRINSIAFHPTDTNTFWAGSPSGGFWVTHDNAASWSCLTDHLESLGATDIIISQDFEKNQTIYVATGDRDSYDNISIGVIKSTDAGITWDTTGLTFDLADLRHINRILQDHEDPLILYAATGDGVYKTSDGGIHWDDVLTETEFIDMELHPVNPNIIYGSTDRGEVFVSTNAGQSWKRTLLEFTGRRTELAVTTADPLRVYAITTAGGLEGIFRSDNEGESFYEVFDGATLNLMHWNASGIGTGGQAWYDLTIAVSPNDPDKLVVGGINTWISTDGGYSWTIITTIGGTPTVQAIHPDKHFLYFRGDELWEGNDGGIVVSYDDGKTWHDKTNGMAISQMYRLAVSQTEPFEILTGLQDNGTKYLHGSAWEHVNGGDGMEAMINHVNANIQYSSSQYGSLFRTYDRWETTRYITPVGSGEGAWTTPFAMHPENPDILFAGYNEILKSLDQGTNWTQISSINASGRIRSMAIAPSNPDIIYVAENGRIWKTVTGEGPFEKLNVVPITNTNLITYMSVKKDDPETVWVSIGGFWDPGVYEIREGGAATANISEGLPQIPIFCVIQNHQYEGVQLFAGTELGVYVKTDDEPWMPFNDGLPNVIVSELEIYYAPDPTQSKLRAATYGRGAWETRLEFASDTMEFVASYTIMASLDNVKPNHTKEEILKIQVITDGDLEPLHVYSMLFDTFGSTDASQDITGARLYYSGAVNNYITDNEIGYIKNPSGTFEFHFDQELIHGENYFWLAYDVSLYATLDNVIDGRFLSFNIGEEKTPEVSDPFGSRLIALSYCDAGSTLANSEHIIRVIAGNVDQTSGRGMNGYQNWTNQVVELTKNEFIDVAVTNSNPHATNDLRLWVDWNQDGELEYPDELYYASGPSGVSTYQFTMAPTINARLGKTMMRFRLHDGSFGANWEPCGYSSLGEVEDYGIMIMEETTHSSEISIPSYRIYPNPGMGNITIDIAGDASLKKVEVIDLYGRVIQTGMMRERAFLEMNAKQSGIYFVKIYGSGYVLLEKIIVNK